MDERIKRIAFGSSLLLALVSPLYAQAQNSNKEAETTEAAIILEEGFESIEQRINKLEQNMKEKFEQVETNLNQRIEEMSMDMDDLIQKIEETNAEIENLNDKVDDISRPHWYSGPIGYAVALAIGVIGLAIGTGGMFGYDYSKKRKRINAYNKVAEDYLEDENFDCCVHALENALIINPIDPETKYGLIDALIKEENKLMKNSHDKNKQERLSEISRRINTEIKVLKNCDKRDFVPYMFEGHRLYFEGERETDFKRRKEKFAQAFGKYEEAKGKYKNEKLKRYWTEIKAIASIKHSKLNVLYRKTGCILMEERNYKEAINNLKTALRYNIEDNESFIILNELKEKLKTKI